jgi:hypothetical protein
LLAGHFDDHYVVLAEGGVVVPGLSGILSRPLRTAWRSARRLRAQAALLVPDLAVASYVLLVQQPTDCLDTPSDALQESAAS